MKTEKFAPLIVAGLVGIALLPVVLSSCGQEPAPKTPAIPSGVTLKADVPLFELPAPSGEKVRLVDILSKHKAVLVNFWFHG